MIRRTALFYPLLVASAVVITTLTSSAEEKAISFEEKHKDKSAIFLIDDVTVEVKEDWSYTTTTHKKLKILKEDAQSMAEIPIPYERDREKVISITAHTVTPDGVKHKYTKIQDLARYSGYPMYSNARVKILTMPEANVGSILEFESKVKSKRSAIDKAFWAYISFETTFPTKELNCTIVLPKKSAIQYKGFNLEDDKPVIKENESTITYSWHMEDIDVEEESEDYTPPPTPESVGMGAEFSSFKKWSDVSDWYYSLIQKNLIINKAIEEAAEKTVEGKTAIQEKVRAILEYVQDNFRYVSMSFGANTLEPHRIDEVFRNKYGDCKDLSLLCMAMLKVAGVKSDIALFTDEYSISDPQYDLPYPTLFDHVLLLVKDPEGGNFYVDPLLKGYDIGQYPLYYNAAYTFLITEDGGRFGRFPIFDEKRNYTKQNWVVNLEENGSAITESEGIWDLDSSIEARDTIKAMSDKEKEEMFQSLETSLAAGGEMLEQKLEGLDERYGQVRSYNKTTRPNLYPVINDMMVIDLGGFNRGYDFTKKDRKNPIFNPGNSLSDTTTIYRIPKGFKVTHVPKNQTLDIGFFSIKYEYQKKKDEVIITETVRRKRLELPKEQYAKVREFFNQLPQKTDRRIMLKKVKPFWGLGDWFKGLWAKIKAQ